MEKSKYKSITIFAWTLIILLSFLTLVVLGFMVFGSSFEGDSPVQVLTQIIGIVAMSAAVGYIIIHEWSKMAKRQADEGEK